MSWRRGRPARNEIRDTATEAKVPVLQARRWPAPATFTPLLPEELLARQHLFPEGRLDQDLQQVDLRGRNSRRMLMDEVPSVELLEVQLVIAIARF